MKNKIKLDGYDDFRCAASQCPITCCQEWKIAVDENTYKKWNQIDEGTAKGSENKVNQTNVMTTKICECVSETEGIKVMKLNQEKKCAFLNDKKLCNLVITYDDTMLSDTCATFPRQITDFGQREEYSLVACCPVVVDMWNQKKEISITTDSAVLSTESPFFVREQMLAIMQNKKYSISKCMMMIFYMLLELQEKEQSIIEFQNPAYLKTMNDTISRMEFDEIATVYERNELFLDIVQNYRKQGLYTNYLEKIAKIAEQIEAGYDEEVLEKQITRFNVQFAKYQHLFRNYLVSEIFTSSLMPDTDLESMIVAFQWISIEYVAMKQSIFLSWLANGEDNLSYEIVRDYMVIIARVTGYDVCDIREYLESSFQTIMWDWGYLALIVGNE